ncbi:MAG: hypothetical protein NT151_00225 [Acidobacteria bacterium]|nr:hypothetical protein [Acidobacteriota bacterium]
MTWRFRLVIGIGVVAALCAGARPASAQSLGDLARQEEARRKAIKAPVKLYTNDSLVQIPGETIPTPPGPVPMVPKPAPNQSASLAADALAATGTTPATPEPDPTKTPEYWRKRIGDARDQRDRNRVYLDALQSRINGLWADFTARDDPAQRALIAADRQRALNELDRLTKEQQELEKQLASIEEEARRAGVPPGWLR